MQTPIATGIAELTDEQLVDRIVKGETKLYERIIQKYNARMYRIGMAIVKNDNEIEDLMQNAYIKAYEHLSGFEFKSAFGTWLVRIMINECLQFIRKKKRTAMDSLNEYGMESKSRDNQTPDRIAHNKELAQALEAALLELPEKYRLVFVMREMEDMSVAETVQALDLTESNVKVRLNRAKSMLRDKLNSYYKSEQVFSFYLTRCNRVTQNVMRVIGA